MNVPDPRPAAVAGLFYPADPEELRLEVTDLLAAAKVDDGPPPRALVVPHAGYVYSGVIAAAAFRTLAPLAGRVRRVVLLGPSHYVAFNGLALPSVTAFETPFGEIGIDPDAAAELADLPQVVVDDRPHEREHSLEVELPFLQRVLGDFRLVPLAVGDATPAEVAQVIARLDRGDETLIVVSSDLSHYLDYAAAQRRDAATTAAVLALDEQRLGADDACGRVPLAGLLRRAREAGLAARLLDQRNSGDTAGPRHRVVGYGAYAFS